MMMVFVKKERQSDCILKLSGPGIIDILVTNTSDVRPWP